MAAFLDVFLWIAGVPLAIIAIPIIVWLIITIPTGIKDTFAYTALELARRRNRIKRKGL